MHNLYGEVNYPLKQYSRLSLPLPPPTLASKSGVVLKPGESLTLVVPSPPVDMPVRRRLRVVGEEDIHWRWRCEPGMPLLYHSIADAIYVPQELGAMRRFLAWYLRERLGNAVCFRPVYRWCGSRTLDVACW